MTENSQRLANDISLLDKYTQSAGQIYLNGIQALVRLPMLQRQRDRQAKLDTGGFITGYRGSPLGGLDKALWSAQAFLEPNNILFQSGLNEELAATALWGTQQTNLYQGALHDGVFGMWYGKGPGVDRCGDVFKHANAAGTSPHGGVLVIAGDDHAAKSSSLPHQSEQAFIAAMMPVLNPAGVQEILDFGLYGWALSRYSGCWVGMKAITECMDSSATVDIDPNRLQIHCPAHLSLSDDDLHIRLPDTPHEQERRLLEYKLAAAERFAIANQLNKVCFKENQHKNQSRPPKLAIVTTGRSYLETCQALLMLGLDESNAVDAGLQLVKIGMTWPLETDSYQQALEGAQQLLVVEEKRGIVEEQLKSALYHWPSALRPSIIGKLDEQGQSLIKASGEFSASELALIIGERLLPHYPPIEQALRKLQQIQQRSALTLAHAAPIKRSPHYCAGCPHNSSTVVPEGSRGLGGIGCHYMVQWMDRNTQTFTQMGGEGATWIGQAPFTATKHVFQNLGDGTYFHSGLLAIRAAIAANVNITYKILYNDAVAMTGGQPLDGQLSVASLIAQLSAEGIDHIAVASDAPQKYLNDPDIAKRVSIHHRNDLDTLQKQFRRIKGVSVIIYEQTCAAEKRRRRKRGILEEPTQRAFINTAVCEACGDCSKQSNCLAVGAVDTELGRKRQIDQDSCNKDFSCLKGYCPSFVTISGGRLKSAATTVAASRIPDLPSATIRAGAEPWNIVIAGIGGTGIVTTAAILGLAAHIENKHCRVMDMTGLAQKFGAVVSHIRVADSEALLPSVHIPNGAAQLLLGCDLVVSADSSTLTTLHTEASAIVNLHRVMTAEFTRDANAAFPQEELLAHIDQVVDHDRLHAFDANRLCKALLGHSKNLNLLLLGIACQQGSLPVSAKSIEQAITLNAQAVEENIRAFHFGRWFAHDPQAVESLAGLTEPAQVQPLQSLEEIVQWRKDYLIKYQDTTLAQHYLKKVRDVIAKEQKTFPGQQTLSIAVAQNYFKLLAYKDEYEVARLFTENNFQQQLDETFEGNYTLSFHFAPSWLPGFMTRNAQQKITVGRWALPLLKALSGLKFLRNTPLDPFGYSREHQWERRMISHYESLLDTVLDHLHHGNYPTLVELAKLPEIVNGYGHIKLAAIKKHEEQRRLLLQRLRQRERERQPEQQIVKTFMPAAH